MAKLFADSLGGVLEDTIGTDVLFGRAGDDIFALKRDGLRDTVARFELGVDKIDITQFNVTWGEVSMRQIQDDRFMFTIRGEQTVVYLNPQDDGSPYDLLSFGEENFIFNDGAATPPVNVVLDLNGYTRLMGTDQTDHFIMQPDGATDSIVNFDPVHDKIDLVGMGTAFGDLDIQTYQNGTVRIFFETEMLIVWDSSRAMTAQDYTEDMFIF